MLAKKPNFPSSPGRSGILCLFLSKGKDIADDGSLTPRKPAFSAPKTIQKSIYNPIHNGTTTLIYAFSEEKKA